VDGNPVNTKSIFYKDADTKVHHYIRLDHVAYFNDDNDHCHDGKTIWYNPSGGIYRTYEFYWSDYKDQNLEYDYWSWAYVGNDFVSIDSGTPTGAWNVEFYLDTYYDSGSVWYGPIATTQFEIRETAPPNHPPVLSDGYIDGEGPWWGYTDSTFQFLVKYTDEDGDAAGTKRLYVYDSGWQYFDMDHLAGNPVDGEWFIVLLTDFSCGTHNCFFHFTDEHDADPYYPETGYLTFTVIESGSDLYCLPAGAKRTDPTDSSTDGTKLLTAISLNGGGQTVSVGSGQTVSVSFSYQLWSASNPTELDQLFFIYSWTPSWPPSSDYYHGVYHGMPGLYPGVSGSDSFTVDAPSSPGTYYLYWCSGAHYSIPEAVNEYSQELTTPAHAKIFVGEPDIDVDKTSLPFEYPKTSSALAQVVINSKDEYTMRCEVLFSGLNINIEPDYAIISSAGCDEVFEPRSPVLPATSFLAVLPPNAMIQSLTLVSWDKVRIPGDIYIQLAPLPTSAGNHQLADSSYEESMRKCQDPYPEQVFRINGIYEFRGYRLLSMTFFAAQYYCSSHKLVQNNKIEIELKFMEVDDFNLEPLFRGLPEDERFIRGIVVNPEGTSLYTKFPIVENPATTYKYVIVTSSDLVDAFQPLVDWKTQKIGSATIKTVSWIASNYPGRDTQEKVRNFITDAYQNWQTEWILLGGDVEVVPYRGTYSKVLSNQGWVIDQNIPCDLYYSDLDGTWDADDDGIFGEVEDNVDLMPDVFVGRAPVNTASEVGVFVDKVLTYEQNPPYGYLQNTLLIAHWMDSQTNQAITKNYIGDNYLSDYTITKVYETSYGSGLDKTAAINSINSGQGIVNHYTHANEYETPPLSISDVDALNNGEKYFIFYSGGCRANKFEDADSVSEHYILNSNGGAVAFIGNSRYGWYSPGSAGQGTSDKYDKEFFKCFNDGYHHVGETLARSKMAFISQSTSDGSFRWIQYCLNLLGDPEMTIKKEEISETIIVSNVGNIDLDVSDITVNYQAGESIGWLSASPTQFTLSPSSSQVVTVTVYPAGLEVGTYHGWLEICSNDPDENPVTVTITLYVIDAAPPDAPTISSTTHSDESLWYSNNDPSFDWDVPPDVSGIKGYSYVLDHSSISMPDDIIDTASNSVSFTDVAEGEWWFHVRAVDNEDNWGPADHYRIRVDTVPPSCSITHTPGSASVYIEATDPTPGSGVYAVYVRIDGGSWTEYLGAGPVEISLSGTGSHLIEAYSIDNANPANEESPPKSLTVHYLTVNTDPPGLDNPTGEGWYDEGTDAPISVAEVSGYTFEYWYLDGSPETQYSLDMDTTVTMDAPHIATAKFACMHAFDFGTLSSPVESGYIAISESTVYSAFLGYGWESVVGLGSRDRGAPDNLRRDLIQSATEHTFSVDLANGDYEINITIGDQSYMHDIIDVYAEDILKIDDLTATTGTFQEVTFYTTITDGQLNLRILDDGGTNPIWVITALTIVVAPPL